MLILALGVAGLLYKSALLILIFVLYLALGLRKEIFPLRDSTPSSQEEGWIRFPAFILLVMSFVFIVLALGSTPAPETAFDSLNVHLPYARDAAVTHRAGFSPNNWSSVMPALPLMSYITAFVFSGLTLAKLFNFLCYLLCGAVIFSFVRRWWGSLHASAAALLFWSSPIALYEATTALIDLPLTLYCAVAVLALLDWTISGARSRLWLSAIFLGLASGCKYHAAFWIVPVFLIIAWEILVRRRVTFREFLALASRFALVAGLLVLPWLLRAWMYTGNPIFPLANSFFQSPLFPPSMDAAARAMYANEGTGASLAALIKLPWMVTFHPGRFRGSLGLLFLPGVVLALMRGRSRQVRYGLVAAGLFFLAWGVTAQEIRYLLPVLPLLCVVTVAGLLGERLPGGDGAASSRSKTRPTAARPILACVASLVIALSAVMSLPSLYPSWVKEWTYWHSYQSPLNYLLGKESAEDYLRRDVPSIYVYDYINEHLKPQDRILLLNDASQYYSRIPTLYSFTVEGEDLLHRETEEGVIAKLRQSQITHVLLNYNGITPLPGVAPRMGVYFFLDKSFQERHLEALYSKNNVVLYRVRSE